MCRHLAENVRKKKKSFKTVEENFLNPHIYEENYFLKSGLNLEK